MSVGLSFQEKKWEIDFQVRGHSTQLGLRTGTILAILALTDTPMFPTKIQVNCLSVQKNKRKINIQDNSHGGHLGFPIGTILAIFYLQFTLMLPTKIQVNCPFATEEEAKNTFSRWRSRRPSGTILAILIYKSPQCFLPCFKSIGLSVQDKKLKIYYKGSHAGIFDFRSEQFYLFFFFVFFFVFFFFLFVFLLFFLLLFFFFFFWGGGFVFVFFFCFFCCCFFYV